MSRKYQKIASNVAAKVLEGSTGTSLASVLRKASSQSQMAMSELTEAVERALRLINDSEHKDVIYSKAGDLITSIPDLMTEIEEGLDIISYASSKIDQKKLQNRIPADTRKQIDQVVKKDV